MKIDIATGSLTICETTVPASLTLIDFLSSAAYQNHMKVSENGPFATYKIESICCGKRFISSLYFKDGVLSWTSVYVSDSAATSNWASWSAVAEQQKLQSFVDSLADQGISNGQRFSWGTVEATYDQRSGASSVTVRYLQR